MNFKDIYIGSLINQQVTESGVDISRICNFFKCSEDEINKMYLQENLPTNLLLKWSKLLEYDFFRLYSQHLILYSLVSAKEEEQQNKKTKLPQFRKSIYTKGVIDFILEQLKTGEMTKQQIIERYKIPRTTLYKWISKYQNEK